VCCRDEGVDRGDPLEVWSLIRRSTFLTIRYDTRSAYSCTGVRCWSQARRGGAAAASGQWPLPVAQPANSTLYKRGKS